jgi:HAD superfamily hydrolase (TIGR01484 family)
MNAVIKKNFSTNSIVLSNESEITPAFKIEVYGQKEQIESFYKEIIELKLGLQIAYMSDNHIEITNIGISKASAIKEFLKGTNVDIKTCMTIGDSANDETMLKASEFSYAMGNSPNDIKNISKYVTKDINENGLGIAIRDYISRTSK